MNISEEIQNYITVRNQYLTARERLIKMGPQILKAVRESMGLTQVQLAAKLGVHPTYLSAQEAGNKQFSVKLLERLYEVD